MDNRAFKFLAILYENQDKYIKSHEITEKLNLKSARNIPHMIKKLNALGFTIESKGGYNGGYKLIDYEKLSFAEFDMIKEIFDFYFNHNSISSEETNLINTAYQKIKKLNKRVNINIKY